MLTYCNNMLMLGPISELLKSNAEVMNGGGMNHVLGPSIMSILSVILCNLY